MWSHKLKKYTQGKNKAQESIQLTQKPLILDTNINYICQKMKFENFPMSTGNLKGPGPISEKTYIKSR